MTIEIEQVSAPIESKPKALVQKKTVKDQKEPKDSKKSLSAIKKLDPETAKVLQSLSDRANKKTYGKKIRDIEIIALGLSLISSEHIKTLQEGTVTEDDLLKAGHAEYQKSHGKLTQKEYLAKILRGEIQIPNSGIKIQT